MDNNLPPPYDKNSDQRIPVHPKLVQPYNEDDETVDPNRFWRRHRESREEGAKAAKRRLDALQERLDIEDHEDLEQNVKFTAVRRKNHTGKLPCIFYIHGGLMVGSDRYVGLSNFFEGWGESLDALVISVEYRRPPGEADDPKDPELFQYSVKGTMPSKDCWRTLCYVWRRRTQLNIDESNFVVYGASAGGCFAASTMIRWADSKFPPSAQPFPKLKGLYLEAPMLDDRHDIYKSRREYAGSNPTVGGNLTSYMLSIAWYCLAYGKPGKYLAGRIECFTGVKGYVNSLIAPGRASEEQVKGFPATFLEVGDADPLKDEGIAFVELVRMANGGNAAVYEHLVCSGGIPHGGWAIDKNEELSITKELLNRRGEKLGSWLGRTFTKRV